MSVKVRTWRRTRGIYTAGEGDSGVEVRVAPGRKSPFRFRREIISRRGNATGLSVATIIVNNAAREYSRNANDCSVLFFLSSFLGNIYSRFPCLSNGKQSATRMIACRVRQCEFDGEMRVN